MKNESKATLSLTVEREFLPAFFLILQGGFVIKARVGRSVKDFLSGQCGLDEGYIAERVSTVFLDGKPVDDLESALLRDGSVLALSGAMPGLVGAVMRRGSAYASFRRSISYNEEGAPASEKEGFIRLKVFNVLMRELGPLFLGRGIYLPPQEVRDFLSAERAGLRHGCREALLDGTPVNRRDPAAGMPSHPAGVILLMVKSG